MEANVNLVEKGEPEAFAPVIDCDLRVVEGQEAAPALRLRNLARTKLTHQGDHLLPCHALAGGREPRRHHPVEAGPQISGYDGEDDLPVQGLVAGAQHQRQADTHQG